MSDDAKQASLIDLQLRQCLTELVSPSTRTFELLVSGGFQDPAVACRRLRQIQCSASNLATCNDVLLRFLLGLWESPNLDGSLMAFERYLAAAGSVDQTLTELLETPRSIEILLRIFIGSQYLTETLLRSPRNLSELTRQRQLADIRSRDDFLESALSAAAPHTDPAAQLDALRRYQRWEILRIGVCDNIGLINLKAATNQLSLLTDGLIRACLKLSMPANQSLNGFMILGMGKLGGEELNYSSDIDLIFLAESQPERWVPTAQKLIRGLQSATGEGFLYRVDMRLRPWGRSGALVCSSASFLDYLRRHAEPWERQAMLKARCIAGDSNAGEKLLALCRPLLFEDSPDDVRQSVRAAKDRIEAELERRGRKWGEVKSGTGSIRDIEFLTQYLQLLHGRRLPEVLTPNTLDGLIRLTDAGLLHADEYRHLTSGYVFLRTIEHALQLMHNKQLHTLPRDPRELSLIARRLDFPTGEAFVTHYERHCRAIRRIYEKHLLDPVKPVVSVAQAPREPASPLLPLFSEADQEQHRQWLLSVTPQRPVRVFADLMDGPLWKVTVVGIDHRGDLSMICGLLFVYGFDILSGAVTTGRYPEVWTQLQGDRPKTGRRREARRDFVDVFTVRPPWDVTEPAVWINYEADLIELLLLLREGKEGDAHGRLAKRVAAALEGVSEEPVKLSPVKVEIDNDRSAEGTVLEIRADDTRGFLYELSNALSLSSIDIEQVVIRSEGDRVYDTLLVLDRQHGGKIKDPVRLEQLQAAVVLIKHFTHLLPKSPNPEAALLHFRSFVRDLFQQPDWLEELSSLERPDVLDALAKLLGVSDFLWEDFLRLQYSNLFPLLRDLSGLQDRRPREQLESDLTAKIATTSDRHRQILALNEFKDREMFRIDMRHILGHIPAFEQFSEELTDVAEVVVAGAVDLVEREQRRRHGTPLNDAGQPVRLAVCALGKCGGRELGFASDIELMFVYSAEGSTTGPDVIENSVYYQRLVEQFTQAIHSRKEGIFQVDLRLRPYGRAGQLAVATPAFQLYYGPEGPAWPFERQALVKFRPIAGDLALGRELLALRDHLIYASSQLDVAALKAMRERQVRQLVRAGTFHAKHSPGGLVDLEYLVQALQLRHGSHSAALRTPNTLSAVQALEAEGFVSEDDGRRIRAAYVFFRRLIDALRMVRGDARDLTVPSSRSEEFEFLARRLGHPGEVARLKSDLELQARHVTELVRKFLPAEQEHAHMS